MKTDPADVAKCKELFNNASKSLQESRWWYHEDYFCGLLNFSRCEGRSASERLTKELRIAKKYLQADFLSETVSNTYGINGTTYESYEDYPTSYLSVQNSTKKRTRHFRKVCQYGNLPPILWCCLLWIIFDHIF